MKILLGAIKDALINIMPLKSGKKNIGYNIKELKADNKKKGKARGAGGKPRSMKQIQAIALSVALGKRKKK